MLFEETLNTYKDEVEKAVDQLFVEAFQNQVNDTDLLLVLSQKTGWVKFDFNYKRWYWNQ